MKKWVCPKHEDVVLFQEQRENAAPQVGAASSYGNTTFQLKPDDRPVECEQCGIYYYRHECKEIDDGQ